MLLPSSALNRSSLGLCRAANAVYGFTGTNVSPLQVHTHGSQLECLSSVPAVVLVHCTCAALNTSDLWMSPRLRYCTACCRHCCTCAAERRSGRRVPGLWPPRLRVSGRLRWLHTIQWPGSAGTRAPEHACVCTTTSCNKLLSDSAHAVRLAPDSPALPCLQPPSPAQDCEASARGSGRRGAAGTAGRRRSGAVWPHRFALLPPATRKLCLGMRMALCRRVVARTQLALQTSRKSLEPQSLRPPSLPPPLPNARCFERYPSN